MIGSAVLLDTRGYTAYTTSQAGGDMGAMAFLHIIVWGYGGRGESARGDTPSRWEIRGLGPRENFLQIDVENSRPRSICQFHHRRLSTLDP
jgi:hypothetical protein